MAAMVIVNNPGDWGQVYAPLLHAPWHGWTPTDLIFPFFVFIVGVSVTLSARSHMPVSVILRRSAIIFGLGLLLALFFRAFKDADEDDSWQAAIGVSALVLLGYWALMMFVPVPGGTAGDLTPSGNLGAWLDRTILGEAHLWRSARTWDPEGLLSTLPAIATALTGVAAGALITSGRSQ
jgi:predicted acyltransferase